MEIKLKTASSRDVEEEKQKCEKGKGPETEPGCENDSGTLASNLVKAKNEKPKWQDGETGDGLNTFGPYTSEAHHLISGNQGLRGHPFEQWICEVPYVVSKKGRSNGNGPAPTPAPPTIEHDTGYSINEAENGLWCPSIPEGFFRNSNKWGLWGPLGGKKASPNDTLTIKQKAAFWIMRKEKIQFHCGHHDPKNGEFGYIPFIRNRLSGYHKNMSKRAKKCQICGKCKSDFYANTLLRRLSKLLLKKICGDSKNWTIFISKFAKELHAFEEKSLAKQIITKSEEV